MAAGGGPRRPRARPGGGTGKLTASLVRRPGLAVTAVEPLAEMRERLQERLPQVTALAGTAEAIPMARGSADVVVVGQAFHWFQPRAALAEIARVLVPGGVLGLLWNMRDDAEPWVEALSHAMGGAGDTASQGIEEETAPVAADPRFTAVELRSFTHAETFDRARLLALAASTSGVASLPPGQREQALAAVERLAAEHPHLCGRETFPLPYRTDVARAVRAD